MIAVQPVEESADHHLQLFLILLFGEKLRRHLLVQQYAACDLMSRQFGYRFEYGRRTVLIHGM